MFYLYLYLRAITIGTDKNIMDCIHFTEKISIIQVCENFFQTHE